MRIERAAGALALTTFSLFSITASTDAHVVSDRENVVLRAIPVGWVTRLGAPDRPDSSGAVGPNRAAWVHVGHQQGVMILLADAAARGDSVEAEAVWRAVDMIFERQAPSGLFLPEPPQHVEATGLCLSELCRAVVAVQNSSIRKRFSWRITLMLPKLRKAVDAVAAVPAPDPQTVRDAVRLTLRAQLFLLADGIYHDERYNKIGQQSLAAALALQREDGGFPFDGAPTPSGQAIGLHALQALALYFPAPFLERALESGTRWMEKQVDGSGKIRSARGPRRDGVLASEIETHRTRNAVLALEYQAVRAKSASAHQPAERIYRNEISARTRSASSPRSR